MILSVVIPVYNDEIYIGRCLDSIFKYCDSSCIDPEVLVVNNGSTDRTSEIVESYTRCKQIYVDRVSISKARNIGAAACKKGDIICFIDSDVVITSNWVAAFSEELASVSRSYLLTGYQYVVRPNPSWIESAWFRDIGGSNYINGGNLIVTRKLFEAVGGFDESLKTGEDVDFCERVKRFSEDSYNPSSKFEAIHLGYPNKLPGFAKRELWHGEGDFQSFKLFRRSKVAQVGIAYLFISFLAAVFLVIDFRMSAFFLAGLIVFNFTMLVYKFRVSAFNRFPAKFFLLYIYFLSRGWALVRALKNKGRKY